MEAHIIDNGFNPFYKKWTFHGEVDIPFPPVMPEIMAEADTDEDEIVDVIYNFISPSNDPDSNDVDVEANAKMGSKMSVQYYDELFWMLKLNFILDALNFHL